MAVSNLNNEVVCVPPKCAFVKKGWFFVQAHRNAPTKCIYVYASQKPNLHNDNFFECL